MPVAEALPLREGRAVGEGVPGAVAELEREGVGEPLREAPTEADAPARVVVGAAPLP